MSLVPPDAKTVAARAVEQLKTVDMRVARQIETLRQATHERVAAERGYAARRESITSGTVSDDAERVSYERVTTAP